MPLQDTVVPLTMGAGVDTKTDSKAVTAKLLELQDAVFTKGHALNKRYGYDNITTAIAGGGNLVDPKMVSEYQGQLVCQDQGRLYAYSPTASTWSDQGPYEACKSTREGVSSSTTAQSFQDAIVWNGYTFYTYCQQRWDRLSVAINSYTYAYPSFVTVRDNATQSTLLQDTAIIPVPTSAFSGEYVVASTAKNLIMNTGGTTVPASAVVVNSTPSITLVTYALSAGQIIKTVGSSLSSGSTLAVSTAGGRPDGTTIQDVVIYDAAGTATGGVVAYATTANALTVKTFNTAGTIANTATVVTGSGIKGISITVDPTNGNIWVYYTNIVGSDYILKYVVYSPTLSVVLASTTIATSTGVFVGPLPIFQATALSVSTTQQQFYFSKCNQSTQYDVTSTTPGYNAFFVPDIIYGTVTTSGVVTTTGTLAYNMDIYSKPVQYDGSTYLLAIYRSFTQGTLFLLKTSGSTPGKPVAKALVSTAFSYYNKYGDANYAGNAAGDRADWTNNDTSAFGWTCSPLMWGADEFGFAVPEVVALDIASALSGASFVSWTTQVAQTSRIIFDFAHQDLYQSITANSTLVMNGGIVWQFDGSRTVELGFNLGPEMWPSKPSTGGSLTGVYQIAAVFTWIDENGNQSVSLPSFLTYDATAVGSNAVVIKVRTPSVTYKSNVFVEVYSTESNLTVLRSLGRIAVDTTASYTVFRVAGSTIYGEQLYTNGGVVENTSPPPALSFTIHNNRLWAIDTANDNLIWYSKTFQPLNSINFSDLLTTQVPTSGGDAVALAGMDSNLVVFEEKFPLVIQGDGYNDAGTGSTLTPAQPIPSDAGCLSSKGIIVFPQGILRKTAKGIYLLDRSLNDSYWGSAVEAYNAQTITSTTLLSDKTQIRFLTDDGLTLVYDYFFSQWSTFTNHEGKSACIYQGQYTYLRTDGDIYTETPGEYLDDTTPIAPLIRTGWLAMSSIQNFERVRNFNMLGDFVGTAEGHGILVSVAYDFSNDYTDLTPYYFTNADNSDNYQFQGYLPRQKCDSMSLIIQEVPTGAVDEYVTFTDTSFVMALKKGLNKLKAAASVG